MREPPTESSQGTLIERVGKKERRKMRARKQHTSVWFGLGTFGVVGWSIALPILIGIVIGLWIDTQLPSQFSWTLMLLFVGVVLGCWNAWQWINRERQIIEEEDKTDDA